MTSPQRIPHEEPEPASEPRRDTAVLDFNVPRADSVPEDLAERLKFRDSLTRMRIVRWLRTSLERPSTE